MRADAYRIIQDTRILARTVGQHSLRDIMMHANQCDGPLSIERRVNKRWRGFGVVASKEQNYG